MKYWYFAEGKVAGPTEGSQLKELAGFDSATLVCPENRSGTNAEDWKPASEFPELQPKVLSMPVAVAVQTPMEAPSANGWQTALADLQKDLRMIRERLEDISRGQKTEISQLQSQFNSAIKDLQIVMERQAAEIAKIKAVPAPAPPPPPVAPPIAAPMVTPVVLEPPMPKAEPPKPAPKAEVIDRWAEPSKAEPVKKEEPKPPVKPEVIDRWAEPAKEEPPKREEKSREFPPLSAKVLKAAKSESKFKAGMTKNKKAMAAAAVIAAAGITAAAYFSMGKMQSQKIASQEGPPASSDNTQPQDAFSDIIQELPPPDSFSNGELMELDGSKAAAQDAEINLFEPSAEEKAAQDAKKKEVKKTPAKKKPTAPKAKTSEPISAENMVIAPAETPAPETKTEAAMKTESAPKTEEVKKTEGEKKPAVNLPGVDITTPSDEEIWPETP